MRLIFILTLRQLATSRRRWIMLALVAVPLLVAGIFQVAAEDTTDREFHDNLINHMIVSVILPLAMLVLAASAFGNEMEDRTLGFLTMKPIARWKIVLPKFLAALIVGGVPVAVSGFAATLLVMDGDVGAAAVVAGTLLVGAAAYGAAFTWAGLATRHSLALGVVYVFVWEASLASYLDGIRLLSIRQYVLALIHGLDDAQLATIDIELGLLGGIVGAALVAVAFFLLAVRRLSRMDVP